MTASPHRRAVMGGLPAAGLAAACARTDRPVVALIPKFTSDPYFVSAYHGAQEAGRELGLAVRYTGPVDANVAGQVDIVDRMVRLRVAAIALCALDPDALAPSLRRARARGIKVSTWDADVARDARAVFLNQTTYAAIGEAIADVMAQGVGPSGGDVLFLTGSLTASNMVAWSGAIRAAVARRHPGLRLRATLLTDQDIEKGRNVTLNYLRAHPETKGVFTNDGGATVSAAEAVKQLGLAPGRITIAGVGVPNAVRPYVMAGLVRKAVLWSPVDIGYAAVCIAQAQLAGTLKPASGRLHAGRLGDLSFTSPDELLLGPPIVFDRDNIGRYHF